MKQIYTKEEWQKVRQLAGSWYKQMSVIPSFLLYVVLSISGIFALANRFNIKAVVIFLLVGGYLYGKEEKIEGYVDGWNEAQGYLKGNFDIDELLKFDEKDQKKNRQEGK